MLGEIMFKDVQEQPGDGDKRDVLRLGIRPKSDHVIVNIYRRGLVDREDSNNLTSTMTVLRDTTDSEETPLLGSIVIDLGDFIEAAALVGGAATRYVARIETDAKSEEQQERDSRYEQMKLTADLAVKKFDKLYAQHEEATAKLLEAEAEVRGLRSSIEALLEQARREGREISPGSLAIEEVAEPVGAPGDAEDETT